MANPEQLAALEAQLIKLKRMRASGVTAVRHGDTSTTFRSMNELSLAISQIESEIAGLTDTRRARVSYISQNSKGY